MIREGVCSPTTSQSPTTPPYKAVYCAEIGLVWLIWAQKSHSKEWMVEVKVRTA